MARKRRFGRVRRLPSGRWQARYKGPDGIDRPASNTFATKNAAERWLSLTEAEIIKDNWLNPDAGRVLFADYARAWVAERPNLGRRRSSCTRALSGFTWCLVLALSLLPTSPNRVSGAGGKPCSIPALARSQ
jgi:hypothetical protein